MSSHFSRVEPRIPSVTAAVGYLAPVTERPHTYLFQPPDGKPWQNCDYRMSMVKIADARAAAAAPSIHREGYELWDAPTAIIDFEDQDAVRACYYEEAVELAKCVTGADKAYVFDHVLRRREKERPALDFGRKSNPIRPSAVGRVHNDYSEASGLKRLALVMSGREEPPEVQRFSIVNIWRSIRSKIVDTPLAVCDARTISAQDFVAGDVHYPHRSGEIYFVHHSPIHKWAYFSEMDVHEALIFKQYDSQVNGVARFTPHAAFDLPEIPPDAPVRESIEIRCLVTYG